MPDPGQLGARQGRWRERVAGWGPAPARRWGEREAAGPGRVRRAVAPRLRRPRWPRLRPSAKAALDYFERKSRGHRLGWIPLTTPAPRPAALESWPPREQPLGRVPAWFARLAPARPRRRGTAVAARRPRCAAALGLPRGVRASGGRGRAGAPGRRSARPLPRGRHRRGRRGGARRGRRRAPLGDGLDERRGTDRPGRAAPVHGRRPAVWSRKTTWLWPAPSGAAIVTVTRPDALPTVSRWRRPAGSPRPRRTARLG